MIKRIITILIILVSNKFFLIAQEVNGNLVSFSEKDGIPSNSIYSILQDHLGFIWIGTDNGLLKYDGYKFHRYDLNQQPFGSLSLFEDSDLNLWIGTSLRIVKYNRIKEDYHVYNLNPAYNWSPGVVFMVRAIEEDTNGTIWLAVVDLYGSIIKDGLAYLKKGENDIKIFNSEHNLLGIQRIYDIEIDKKNNLWVSGIGGLRKIDLATMSLEKIEFENSPIRSFDLTLLMDENGILWGCQAGVGFGSYDPSNGKVKAYSFNSSNNNSISNNNVNSIVQDKDGTFWLGTDNGINHFNPETENFKRYFYQQASDIDYRDIGKIRSILKDKSGSLWLGSANKYVHKFDLSKNLFQNYKYDPSDISNISFRSISGLLEDTEGNIWIGGPASSSLFKYNSQTSTFTEIPNDDSINTRIMTIYQDREQTIWIGSLSGGLLTFNPANSSFNNIIANFPGTGNSPRINDILEDHLLNFWVGTHIGLFLFDRSNRKMERIDVKEIKDNSLGAGFSISHIFESRKKELWIGTDYGLYKYIHNSKTFKRYLHDPYDLNSLSSSTIVYIHEDKDGILWLATWEGGLNRFDPEIDEFTHYTKEDGLPSDNVMGILEDEDNNALWLGTFEGISRFDLITKEFRNFDASHGLQGNRFLNGSALETTMGEFIFGGVNGLNIFHPDDVLSNLEPPDLIISDLKIFNTSVPVGDDSPLQKPIYQTEEIVLASDENDISIDFLATHFVDPSHNEYAYMLENYENEWRYVGNTNSAIYPNLPPGEYIFHVKAANNVGVWNREGVSIKIIILPPWWATSWAYIVYAIIFFNIIYFTWKIQLKRIRIKHDYEMSKFEAEKMHEVDEMKSRFFANLSHEFRTPLTLITGPAKQIIDETNENKIKDRAGIIYRSGVKLNRLVAQLLDLSKIEAGEMSLRTSRVDIISLLKDIVLSFTPLAEKKSIILKFNPACEKLLVYLDRDKVEQIINNILSNAFKFTAECGEIIVEVDQNEKTVDIKISDTGIGIAKDRLAKIFDRFYQVDGSHTREQEGTGIGLALTKELVELHSGEIEVESEEGEGTTFTIRFPLGKNHLRHGEIFEEEGENNESNKKEITEETIHVAIPNDEKNDIKFLIETELSDDKEGKPLLLIVEDNVDVRIYIKGFLEKEYRIVEAVDGEDGQNKSIEHIPDLIVSDVMMPKIDGFQLCERLKTDERTSHIPIILLTAKATSKDKIEGLETGADDYIMKPFDPQELTVRIKNLIEQRKKLREHFLQDAIFNLDNKKISSIDKKFLERTVKVINEHLSDSLFGVEPLANELAIGRTSLHKKIVALVGEPPGELIKRIRLSTAGMLLKNKTGNISEIALEVGFNNPAYFSECFKKQFSLTPSQYLNNFNPH